MLRFLRPFVLPITLLIALLPHQSLAALIPRYDLESLCCLSTDAVEATLVRHHTSGHPEWEDRFTATVVNSLAGRYKPGDKISGLDLFLYNPNANSQHCILFITRREFQFYVHPVKMIAPQAVDMLLTDRNNRVRRYFQIDNPGGLDAEGYEPDSRGDQIKPEDTAAEKRFPTLAAECGIITAKWAAVDRLRPLLFRKSKREDAVALQALTRERRYPSAPGLRNIVGEIAQDRLASLHA